MSTGYRYDKTEFEELKIIVKSSKRHRYLIPHRALYDASTDCKIEIICKLSWRFISLAILDKAPYNSGKFTASCFRAKVMEENLYTNATTICHDLVGTVLTSNN
jgi:hypothetical protein